MPKCAKGPRHDMAARRPGVAWTLVLLTVWIPLLTSCQQATEPPESVESSGMTPASPQVAAGDFSQKNSPDESTEPEPAELESTELESTELESAELESAELDDTEKKQADWLAGLPPLPKNPLAGCQQCHVDVEDTFIGSAHYKAEVACKDCHGPSEGHIADENNDVKPDERFAREDVNRLCSKCHECDREVDNNPVESKVCTECHGWHEVNVP